MRGPLFRPQSRGAAPAILLLHTRGGLGQHERGEAAWYASQGFVVFAPDYFAPIGITSATFDLVTFVTRDTNAVVDHLARGVDCLRGLAGVDRDHVAAVGYSLGGYVGLALAGRPGISATAGWYTALSSGTGLAAQLAISGVASAVRVPVLLLHGDADPTSNIDNARGLQAALVRSGKRSELVVFPGVGHGYDQQGIPQYRYDVAATADSRARTVAHVTAGR